MDAESANPPGPGGLDPLEAGGGPCGAMLGVKPKRSVAGFCKPPRRDAEPWQHLRCLIVSPTSSKASWLQVCNSEDFSGCFWLFNAHNTRAEPALGLSKVMAFLLAEGHSKRAFAQRQLWTFSKLCTFRFYPVSFLPSPEARLCVGEDTALIPYCHLMH